MTHNEFINRNSVFAWIAGFTGLVLLIPLAAMQVTEEVVWTAVDFFSMAVLLFGAGSCYVLVSRRIAPRHRVILVLTTASMVLYVWAELAVGIFFSIGS
ncbi:MAG: hypothetical protein KGY48_04780 [Wenzhouxiangellaceae bacterium]|jgi:hypothetical protein|nr:hypothetical protein [Wenzhouxiangellaceae bacterium]MBS3747509.1 hypothetical protein [Wenzhouxiangellaceae bacterium]MBS3824476.1 hypothetical protein [Wenzhouxiangellaceae bacterium]